MKQFAFLSILMAAAALGAFFSPFWGVLLYYFLAVLRPQYLWDWALPGDTRWSLMAAGIAFFSAMLYAPRLILTGRLNRVAWLAIAYTFVIGLSVLTAHDTSIAQDWAGEFAKIIVMVLLAMVVIEHAWQINLFGVMILLCLGYGAYEINYNYFLLGRLDIFHVGFGGLDNNGAGLMISMGIPLAYVFGVTAKHRWQSALAWMLGLFMIHAMLMSYSRGAMLATVVGSVWLLLHHRPRWQAGGLAIAMCLVISLLAGKEIRERFFSTQSYQEDNSAQSRFDSWSAAWRIASDHPLLGVGVRNSSLYSQRYGADLRGRTIHSQYLQIAADSGMIAMALYIVLLIACLRAFGFAGSVCREYLLAHPKIGPPDHDRYMLILSERLALGFQTSLVIFAVGGLFLSLEVFELPWLLITLAGVSPLAALRLTSAVREKENPSTTAAAPGTPPSNPTRPTPSRNPKTTSPQLPRPRLANG